MRGVFVTGTDTDVGKTVLSALLMAASSPVVRYWKPVQTGCDEDDDTRTVTRLTGLTEDRVLDAGVRLPLPASPHHAAHVVGQTLSLEPLLDLAAIQPDVPHVVEGAGGLLVPLSDEALLTDLVRALELPIVVAASTRLGCINHTLLTVRTAQILGLTVLGVVLIGPPDPSATTGITAHAGVPILAEVPHLDPLDPATVAAAALDLPPLEALRP